jgi:5-hydroxyisourate hydrolase-like protein (transthyretin family)
MQQRIMIKYSIIVLTAFVLTSCDSTQQVKAVVLDKQTKQPINNVLLSKPEKLEKASSATNSIYTNAQGQFSYTTTSSGCKRNPYLQLFFSKDGYKTQQQVFAVNTNNDTVYLEKIIVDTIAKPIANKVIDTNKTNITEDQYSLDIPEDLTKAYVRLSEGDSTIYVTANIRKDHRIFGYAKPNIKSEKLILFSVFTNDVEGNPFHCKLGAYYETSGYKEAVIKYLETVNTFVKAVVINNSANEEIIIFFEKKWIELE